MPNSRYRSGYNFERRVSAHLRDEGYWTIESRGSHGLIDVVAVKPGQILGVQAKTDGYLMPADWDALVELCRTTGMVPVLACRDGQKLRLWELLGPKVFGSRPAGPKRLFVTDEIAA